MPAGGKASEQRRGREPDKPVRDLSYLRTRTCAPPKTSTSDLTNGGPSARNSLTAPPHLWSQANRKAVMRVMGIRTEHQRHQADVLIRLHSLHLSPVGFFAIGSTARSKPPLIPRKEFAPMQEDFHNGAARLSKSPWHPADAL
ncbi:hypothetical protein C0Q70_19175 [Pomacea canaliculata]|uniref:Uncharacterized protein n=1 Tax=Pomacea canaliculata TaxID=400727 RepID=A0A2T7NIL3_POMCA|nr:hypothetical protein C0Q70_19175 [Pomacea canaliculata]